MALHSFPYQRIEKALCCYQLIRNVVALESGSRGTLILIFTFIFPSNIWIKKCMHIRRLIIFPFLNKGPRQAPPSPSHPQLLGSGSMGHTTEEERAEKERDLYNKWVLVANRSNDI